MADDAHTNASLIGRLLEEISREGNRVRLYRRGGLGMENVLTTEVLSPLSYLPRQHFLSEVLRAAHGAEAAMAAAASEIEDADLFILPPQLTLQPGAVVVQPDAVIESPNNYVLVEAKRIRRHLPARTVGPRVSGGPPSGWPPRPGVAADPRFCTAGDGQATWSA